MNWRVIGVVAAVAVVGSTGLYFLARGHMPAGMSFPSSASSAWNVGTQTDKLDGSKAVTATLEHDTEDGGKISLSATCDSGAIDINFEYHARDIRSLIGRFTRGNDEIASIQSTADAQTDWILSDPMAQSLARHDVDFTVLKKRPTTVYVILPPERVRTHSVWMRLLIVTALRSLYSPGGLRTLFMLDEFPYLGHLDPIEDALALVRG